MGPTKKKRVRSAKSLKAELDRVFSIFIRQRGADRDGFNTCISCGAVRPWRDLQCGHYYRRVHLGTRWHENNCHPQCPACNILRRGNYASFARFMYGKYTLEELDELDGLHRQTMNFKRSDLEAMIEKYKGTA